MKEKILMEAKAIMLLRKTQRLFFQSRSKQINVFLILTGYHSLQQMFWEKKKDAEVALVQEAMNRKSIEKIKQYIHFTCNDNLNTNDKFTKVTKLYDIANKTFQQFGYFHLYYSIDRQWCHVPRNVLQNKLLVQNVLDLVTRAVC